MYDTLIKPTASTQYAFLCYNNIHPLSKAKISINLKSIQRLIHVQPINIMYHYDIYCLHLRITFDATLLTKDYPRFHVLHVAMSHLYAI